MNNPAGGISRRQFILGTTALGLSVPSLAGLLAACGGGEVGEVSPFADSYSIADEVTGTEMTVTVESGVRTITANGLPNHVTGEFPNPGSPHSISAQTYEFALPAIPVVQPQMVEYNVPQPFGIAVNGVLIDPLAAEWFDNDPDSGWQLAALAGPLGFDSNNAHVQPSGAYHYHGPISALVTTQETPILIGWAGDGFPIYGAFGHADPDDAVSPVVELMSSYRLKTGDRQGGPGGPHDGTYVEDYEYVAGSGDLDECNGRFGVTPEHPDGIYHYVATNQWPNFGRCFVGNVAESFIVGRPER